MVINSELLAVALRTGGSQRPRIVSIDRQEFGFFARMSLAHQGSAAAII